MKENRKIFIILTVIAYLLPLALYVVYIYSFLAEICIFLYIRKMLRKSYFLLYLIIFLIYLYILFTFFYPQLD